MDPTLLQTLTRARVLPDLIDLPPEGQEIYLVGGTLRDHLLGRSLSDFDFALPDDPTSLAQAFARRIGGRWFFLDEGRRQSRVAARGGEGIITYDFAPFRAPSLEEDLRLRDFTVNALALPLHAGERSLLDPLGGEGDLFARRLRGCSPGVFADDPLRVIKGVRHAVVLDFEIEQETAASMRTAALHLDHIAPERIRAELGTIFSSNSAISALFLMQNLNCLEGIFGPSQPMISFENGARLAERCERILWTLASAPQERTLLDEKIEGEFSRGGVLKMAAFAFGSQGKRMHAWGERLKLGRKGSAVLKVLSDIDSRRIDEMESVPMGRPRALWAASLGRTPIEALIFLAVLHPAGESDAAEAVRPVLRDYLDHLENGRIPDLLSGDEIGEILGRSAGPLIGKAQSALRRQEIAGSVRTLEEARKFLKSKAKKWIDNP